MKCFNLKFYVCVSFIHLIRFIVCPVQVMKNLSTISKEEKRKMEKAI